MLIRYDIELPYRDDPTVGQELVSARATRLTFGPPEIGRGLRAFHRMQKISRLMGDAMKDHQIDAFEKLRQIRKEERKICYRVFARYESNLAKEIRNELRWS